MQPDECVCGGIDMGGDNWDLDVRPDCPVHGDQAPADRPVSGKWITEKDPF